MEVAVQETLVNDFSVIMGRNDIHVSEKTQENADSQNSSGVMNGVSEEVTSSGEAALQEPSPYRTTGRSIEDIEISTIQNFDAIPDYRDSMDSDRPYVLRTPEGFFFLDGREIIQQVRAQGMEFITCDVETVERWSRVDLMLRKIASRIRTRGGEATYAEKVRNVRLVTDELRNSNEDLTFFGHGGRRYGEGFTNDQENDIRSILETRLGKNRNTINSYILHGEHLTPETMEILVNRNIQKGVFETYQRRKRKLYGKLQKDRLSYPEIASLISTDFISFLEESEQTASETISDQEQTPAEQLEQNDTPEETIDQDDGSDDNNVSAAGENAEPADEEIDDEEEVSVPAIKRSVLRSARRIEEAANEEEDANHLAELLRQEMMNLQRILNRLNSLRNEGALNG